MKKVFVFGTGKLYKKKEDDIKKHYDIVGFLIIRYRVLESHMKTRGFRFILWKI